jgi:hypothetical protein
VQVIDPQVAMSIVERVQVFEQQVAPREISVRAQRRAHRGQRIVTGGPRTAGSGSLVEKA